jgi:hypothetical protein
MKAMGENINLDKAFKELFAAVEGPAMLYAVLENMPKPIWVKGVPPKCLDPMPMRFLNLKYDVKYLQPLGKSRDNYVDDFQMWGPELGEIYTNHDWRVWLSGEPDIFVEKIKDATGGFYYDAVQKYPVRSKTGRGFIVGFSIETELIEKINKLTNQ